MAELAIQFALTLTLLIAVVVVITVSLRRMRESDVTSIKAEALDQFNKWLASSAADQLGLHPDACQIVKESETIGQSKNGLIYSYTLTRFLRNREGQYVMFKSTPRGPYVKLIAPSVAKAVLKEQYVPPSNG